MNKEKFRKLINKYNKILSERYGVEENILENGFTESLDSIAELMRETCNKDTYRECMLIRKWLIYISIKEDIELLKEIDISED